jgi:hypothetical protein
MELYCVKLVLYLCGDLINDCEGISGYEPFQPDLVLTYFMGLAAEGRIAEVAGYAAVLRPALPPRTCKRCGQALAGCHEDAHCQPLGTRIRISDQGLNLEPM